MKTLVITGIFSPLGSAVARWALDAGVRVLGVDRRPMTKPFPGIEFIQTDIRNPLFPQLLKAEGVDALFHSAFRWRLKGTQEDDESNVLGTMKLLEAAAQARVTKVIIPSSIAVHGAHPQNPPFIQEEQPFRGRADSAFVRHLRDIETFLDGFRHQAPELTLTILRFAHILGRHYPSPLARYLSLPVIPTLFGYNPRLQVIHFDDVMQVIALALLEDHPGTFHVAAQPPLHLKQIIHLSQRIELPIHPSMARVGEGILKHLPKKKKEVLPIPWSTLRFSLTVSTERLTQRWGFVPHYRAEAVITAFAMELQQKNVTPYPSTTSLQPMSGRQ